MDTAENTSLSALRRRLSERLPVQRDIRAGHETNRRRSVIWHVGQTGDVARLACVNARLHHTCAGLEGELPVERVVAAVPQTENLSCGAGERGVARDVAGERRGDKVEVLVGEPAAAIDRPDALVGPAPTVDGLIGVLALQNRNGPRVLVEALGLPRGNGRVIHGDGLQERQLQSAEKVEALEIGEIAAPLLEATKPVVKQSLGKCAVHAVHISNVTEEE